MRWWERAAAVTGMTGAVICLACVAAGWSASRCEQAVAYACLIIWTARTALSPRR